MRIAVLVGLATGERPLVLKQGNDALVRIEDVFSDKIRKPAFVGVSAIIIDRREQRQVVLQAQFVVVLAVPGRDMHAAGPGIEGHKVGRVNCCRALEKRMSREVAFQLTSRKGFLY